MKISKKLLVIGIALSMIIAVLSGCANTNNKADNDPNADPDSSANEKVKLTFMSNINVDTEGKDVNDNLYIKYVEDKNNIDLELLNDASNNPEQKMYTIMASGNLPDFLVINKKQDLQMFASQGLLMPLDDLLEKHPDFLALFEPVSLDLAKYEDQMYAIPAQRYDPTPLTAFALKSWVDKLGIDPNKAMTTDEWYEMLRAFTQDDPDDNGLNDTFGMTALGEVDLSYNLFMDAFDAAKYQYIDGEVQPNYVLDGYKEWLKFMNKLYKDNILDKEYIVNTSTQLWEKAASNKYGTWQWFWSQIEFESAGGKREDIVALKPPLKKDGSQSGYLYTSPVRHFIAITKDAKHPEKIIELQKWITSEEGKTFEFAGIEGFDYDMTDGNIVFKEGRKGKNSGWRNKTVGIMSPVADESVQSILKQSYSDLAMEQMNHSLESGVFDEIKMLAPFFPELADYDLDSMVKEFRDKAIVGQIDIDAQWDNFITDWHKSGGDKFIELHTKWYNESYKK